MNEVTSITLHKDGGIPIVRHLNTSLRSAINLTPVGLSSRIISLPYVSSALESPPIWESNDPVPEGFGSDIFTVDEKEYLAVDVYVNHLPLNDITADNAFNGDGTIDSPWNNLYTAYSSINDCLSRYYDSLRCETALFYVHLSGIVDCTLQELEAKMRIITSLGSMASGSEYIVLDCANCTIDIDLAGRSGDLFDCVAAIGANINLKNGDDGHRLFMDCKLLSNCSIVLTDFSSNVDIMHSKGLLCYSEITVINSTTDELPFGYALDLPDYLCNTIIKSDCSCEFYYAKSSTFNLSTLGCTGFFLYDCNITSELNTLNYDYDRIRVESAAYSVFSTKYMPLIGSFSACTIVTSSQIRCESSSNSNDIHIIVTDTAVLDYYGHFIYVPAGFSHNNVQFDVDINGHTDDTYRCIRAEYGGTWVDTTVICDVNVIWDDNNYSCNFRILDNSPYHYTYKLDLQGCTLDADMNVSGEFYGAFGCAFSTSSYTTLSQCTIWDGYCKNGTHDSDGSKEYCTNRECPKIEVV